MSETNKVKGDCYYPIKNGSGKVVTPYGIAVISENKVVEVASTSKGLCDADKTVEYLELVKAQKQASAAGKKAIVDKSVSDVIAKPQELPKTEQEVVTAVTGDAQRSDETPPQSTPAAEPPEEGESIPPWVRNGDTEDITKNEMIDWATARGIELNTSQTQSKGKVLNAIKEALNV